MHQIDFILFSKYSSINPMMLLIKKLSVPSLEKIQIKLMLTKLNQKNSSNINQISFELNIKVNYFKTNKNTKKSSH